MASPLHLNARTRAYKAAPIRLPRNTTAEGGFALIMRSGFDQLHRNHVAAANGDIESIHQMRVALRRLNATLALFKEVIASSGLAGIKKNLKWLSSRLGEARDWDVFETKTLQQLGRDPSTLAAADRIAKETGARRVAADGRAIRALRSARYRRFLRAASRWLADGHWCENLDLGRRLMLDEPLIDAARPWLHRSAGKVRKAGRGIRRLKAKQRHRLRIALKRLRYDTDALSSLYAPKVVKPYVVALRTLQDVLGSLNDVAVARQLMGVLEGRYPVAIDNRLRADKQKRIKALPPAWRTFRGIAPFWR